MNREEHSAYAYLRQTKKFPNVWCAGCGIGIVMGALIRAIDRLGLDKDQVAVISGIGCTGRMPVYILTPCTRRMVGRWRSPPVSSWRNRP